MRVEGIKKKGKLTCFVSGVSPKQRWTTEQMLACDWLQDTEGEVEGDKEREKEKEKRSTKKQRIHQYVPL